MGSSERDAANWLKRAKPGYCNITLGHLEASCAFGSRGALGLSREASRTGWSAAAGECLAKCMRCPRCEFMSLSVRYSDCSWYSTCDLSRLNDATAQEPAFQSAAVVRRRGPPAVQSKTGRLQAVARSLEGLHCLSPSGLPIEEPHLPADLAELERAMLDGRRVLKLPHHLLRLTTINPDNVGETLGTLLSALAVQADAPHTSWQLSWTPVQKRPTPKHALSLLRHMSRYIWRNGLPFGLSETAGGYIWRNGSPFGLSETAGGTVVGCYGGVRVVQTYDFAPRVRPSWRAVAQLRALLRPAGASSAPLSPPAWEQQRGRATARRMRGTNLGNAVAPIQAPRPVAILFQRPRGRSDNGRAIVNEADTLSALDAAGFEPSLLSPSQLSLSALARRLGSAALLVGVHGAALAHCMWLPRGRSALIEVFLPDHAYGLYPLFARAAGVLHLPLLLRWPSVDRRPAASLSAFKASAWARWPGYRNDSVLEQLKACSAYPLSTALYRLNLFERGHCVDIAKSADYTIPSHELRHVAGLALSHVLHASSVERRTDHVLHASSARIGGAGGAEDDAEDACSTCSVRRSTEDDAKDGAEGSEGGGADGSVGGSVGGSEGGSEGGSVGGGAPTALSLRPAPLLCEDAFVLGVERLTLLDPQQGAVPSVSARHTLSRYLRGMGFCPRMVPVDGIKCMHPRGRGFCPRLLASSQALDASIENASLVIRVAERSSAVLSAESAEMSAERRLRLRRRGAVLIDLVTSSSVTHSVHAAQAMSAASTAASSAVAPGSMVPVDGILPIPGFCLEHGPGCQLTLQTLEVLLRFALVALHPLSDTSSFTQGPLWKPLWKRRPGAAMPKGGAGAGCRC